MKTMLMIVLLSLSGCASLGGQTNYTVEPIVKQDGTVICCKATVHNSKDYDSLKFKFVMKKDGTIEAVLDEKGVNASDPAAVMADSNGKMLDAINALLPKVLSN